jgi:DNA polymerase (family 10)
MTKEQIAGVLERIAMLLELKGENPFKIRAYTNAARAIGEITKFFGQNEQNGANGMSDIEGKIARVATSELGQRASFNFSESILLIL